MEKTVRKTGIDIIGDVPWGTHFCQFYQTKQDLIDILVPYFEAGLANNEFCMWITCEPLSTEEARSALRKEVENLDDYISKGQIEILDYSEWYTKSGRFNADEVLEGWVEKEKHAVKIGFDGLRLTGNTFWLEKKDWQKFTDYEATVNSVIGQHRMLAACTYSLERCAASEIVDVVSNHQFALIKRQGRWEIIQSAEYQKTIEALRQNEERYRNVYDTAPLAFVVWDNNCSVIEWNKRAEDMFGWSQEEMMGKNFFSSLIPESERPHVGTIVEALHEGRLLSHSVSKNLTKNGRIILCEWNNAILRDANGEVTGAISMGLDVTERKQAEEALQKSERDLSIRNRIVEIFLSTPDEEVYGQVLQVLLEAMESKYGIFGYIDEHETLIVPSLTRDIWEQCQVPDKTIEYPREKWGGIWGRALKEKRSLYANEGLHVPEGHVPIIRVLVVPIMYGGATIGLLEVANKTSDYGEGDKELLETIAAKIAPILNARLQRDTQERQRKQAEQALRESENKYRTLLKNIPHKIFYKDLNSAYMLCNESFAEDLGIEEDGIKRKTDYDFFPKALADKYRADDRRIIESGKAEEIEEQYVRDGQEISVHTFKAPVKDEKGNTVGVFGIFWDVTERKRAEDALKRSQERYALAQRAAKIGSWDWDITTGRLVWSEQIEPMFGFAPGEFGATYEAFLDCVHPEDRRHVIDSVNACVEDGKDYAIEHRILWPDGTVRWVSETGDVVRSQQGKAIRMLGVVQDITERKDSETRRILAAQILDRLNQKTPRRSLIGDVLKLIKDHFRFSAVGIRLREGDDFPYFEVHGFSDDFVEAENYLCARNESGEQIYDAQGRPVLACMCGSVIIGHADPDLPFFTEGGSFWTNGTTELQSSASLKALQIPLRNRCNQAGYESVALVPLRCGDEIVGLLQLNDSRPGRFTSEIISFFEELGASIGIALARVRAEEQAESLAKFPSEDPYPVLRIAEDSTILYANAAGSELLKTWACDVGGRAPEHWHQYISRILKSQHSEELEVKCGDRVFSLIMAPVVDAAYVNAYGIDITERKLAEEDLRKYRQHLEELVETRTGELTEANKQLLQEIEVRKQLEREILNVSEQERRRIGQELHDSLGQQLTGIAFMTKVLEQRLGKESAKEAAEVAEIGNLVNQATEQARGLSKGLHPVDLDAGTLASALQELATSTERLFGIGCTFECGKRVKVANPEIAVHLYRITQEAITNAIKHGKAKKIHIKLAYGRDKSVLTVRNDGVDFPKEFEARGTGMGLQIMDHRVDIIGGSLDMRKAPGGGTVMTCKFPNKKR